MSLSLTQMSEARALRILNATAYTQGKRAAVRKVSGAALTRLLAAEPALLDRLFVINRSMFGSEQGLGPDDEASLQAIKDRGTAQIVLRCNQDRDLITVRL